MSHAIANVSNNPMAAIENVLMRGDLSALTPEQRVQYLTVVCDTVGLNKLTKPFEYITLNGKLVLYATKGCAEQLRQVHKISIKIPSRETIEGVYVVTAEAAGLDGRVDSSTGAVSIAGLKGEALANAFMKCETKAKRRVTLSICGLNMLDETEVETIPGVTLPTPSAIEPKATIPPRFIPNAFATPTEDHPLTCELCNAALKLTKSGVAMTCTRWEEKAEGKHTFFTLDKLDAYRRYCREAAETALAEEMA